VKRLSEFFLSTLGLGALAVAPIYIASLLLIKLMKSLAAIARPLAKLLPKWLPAEQILSLLLVFLGCFLIGLIVHTKRGRATWERMEIALLRRIPGYTVIRSLTQQLAGKTEGNAWKPALAEIEEALVPAFIIEEHEDGRFTVFVPSVPTPFAGAVYILTPDRVHPLDVPFRRALKVVSQWGSGSKDLVAAMDSNETTYARGSRDDVRIAP
jgi:uncharacterized membrane protein